LRHFLDAVRLGKPDVSSAASARRDLEIVMAAQESLTSGNPTDCPPAYQTV
jgi:hypothetical protein